MNRMFIKCYEDGIDPMSFLLQDDFTVEAQSEFSSFGELLPGGINELITAVTAFSASGGNASKGVQYMSSVMDMKRWTKTNPLSINLELKFYVKTDVIADVVNPTVFFCSMGILTYKPAVDGKLSTYTTPGPNLNSLKEVSAAINGKINFSNSKNTFSSSTSSKLKYPTTNKLMSVWIPGVAFIPAAFVESVTPTYSKYTCYAPGTQQEFPLWSKLQLKITGVTPATDSMLADASKIQIGSDSALDSISAFDTQNSEVQSRKDELEKTARAQESEQKEEIGDVNASAKKN